VPNIPDSPDYEERELTKYTAFVLKTACRKTVWFHVPNGEKRDKVTAALLRQMGVRPGVADFILLCHGQAIAVEVKTLDGRQSKDQKDFAAVWQMAGGIYAIVRTPREIDGLRFQFMLD
jgi:hypothetical protein